MDAIPNHKDIPLSDLIDKVNALDKTLEYRCSPLTTCSGFHPIHFFSLLTNNRPDILPHIKLMLQNDPTLINIKNENSWTPLMLSVRNSRIYSSSDTIRLLLNFGADPNIKKNDNGWTALHLATGYSNTTSNVDAVRLLLDAGADVNMKNNDEWTALAIAARYSNTDSNIDTVRLLLDAGADVNMKNNHGLTALHLAARYSNTDSNTDAVKLLINVGADVNTKNNDGWTALALATRYSNTDSKIDTVRLLINAGADTSVHINSGRTVLDLSLLSDIETTKLLLLNTTLTVIIIEKIPLKYIDDLFDFILTHKRNLSDDVLKKMISYYNISEEMFHRIASRSSLYVRPTRVKIDMIKLNKARTDVRLHRNGLMPKMLAIKNTNIPSSIDTHTLNKIKDFLSLNEIIDTNQLIKQIDNYYLLS